MPIDNIKDFTLTWILAGLLAFALLSFAFFFVYNNNPVALGDSAEQLQFINDDLGDNLIELESDSDVQFNISSELNSQDAILGGDSASSTSFNFMEQTQGSWTIIKQLIAWVFAGDFGLMVIKILGGIIGLAGLYFVIKLIRSLF